MEEDFNDDELYSDLKEFFSVEERVDYLLTVVPSDRLKHYMNILIRNFTIVEKYEECTELVKWKKILAKH